MSQSESQNSLLEDVSSWSKDTCKARLTDTLPQLICQYCSGGSAGIKTSVLRVMIDSFMPCLDLQSLQQQFFSKVLPQTCQLFDDTLVKVSSTVQNTTSKEDGSLKEKLQNFLQITLDVLECLASCVSYVIDVLCGGALSIDTVRSLPSSVLHIVKGSFHHCKDSTATYGDHFPLVSGILSSLFKKAYSLQKSLTVLLDAVQLKIDDGDDSIEALEQLCNGFHDLCIVIGDMDSTLLVSTWRFLVKLACKHKEPLKNTLQLHPIVATLCSDIEANYEQCLRLAPHPPSTQSSQGGDERAFQKTLKIGSLCAKMLMHLMREFEGYLGPCLKELYHLVLVLQSRAPPSVHAPAIFDSARDQIERSLLVCVEPLLQQLVDNHLFHDAVTALRQDMPPNLQFGRLLTLVKILKLLPSCQESTRADWMEVATLSWEEPRDSVLQAVFNAYRNCYVELALPVKMSLVMSPGQPQQSVSLREYLTVHCCGFVASVGTRHFGGVERCLLENVVSREVNAALLAMDVWCFLARYSTAELCTSHVHLVADLLTSTPANHCPSYIHLSMLLWRLVPLMAQEHQGELPTRFPPSDHRELWSQLLPLLAFQEATRKTVAEGLVSRGLTECDTWLNNKEHTFGSLKQLETALACLSNVYGQFENASPPISKHYAQSVMEMVVRLWEALPLVRIKSHDVVSFLIDLSGLILAELQPRDLAKVISQLCSVQHNAPLKVKLAIVNLLHRSRKVKVQSCSQLKDILCGLAELFSSVLGDKSCVIRQLALQAFSTFAEETAHESVVPECLHDESTHSRVVDFLNRIPQQCTPTDKTEVQWLQQQAEVLLQHAVNDDVGLGPRPGSADSEQDINNSEQQQTGPDNNSKSRLQDVLPEERSNQPASKRAKMEGIDEGYRQAIAGIHASLQTVQELRDRGQGSTPSWVMAELRLLRDRIVSLIQD